jgi:hypothetical protein
MSPNHDPECPECQRLGEPCRAHEDPISGCRGLLYIGEVWVMILVVGLICYVLWCRLK